MIDIVSLDLGIMLAIVVMGFMAIRRCMAMSDERFRSITRELRELRELRDNRIGIHHPAGDPEPSAIVVRPEPPPGNLPRATARTRSKS